MGGGIKKTTGRIGGSLEDGRFGRMAEAGRLMKKLVSLKSEGKAGEGKVVPL